MPSFNTVLAASGRGYTPFQKLCTEWWTDR